MVWKASNHQVAVPSKKRIRRHERAELPQDAPTQSPRLNRQAAAFRIREAQPLLTEPFAEDTVLLPQVVNYRVLLPVELISQG